MKFRNFEYSSMSTDSKNSKNVRLPKVCFIKKCEFIQETLKSGLLRMSSIF